MMRIASNNAPKPSFPCPVLEQCERGQIVWSSDDDGASSNICRFNETVYKRMDIWARLDQIQDGPRALRDIDPAHAAELEDSFCHHIVDYSCEPTSVTAVLPDVELFDTFNTLEIERRKMMLHNDFQVGVMHVRHRFNILQILLQFTEKALAINFGQSSCQLHEQRKCKVVLRAFNYSSHNLQKLMFRHVHMRQPIHIPLPSHMNYSVTLEPEYDVQFFQLQTSKISHELYKSQFIQASLSYCSP